MSQGKRGDHSRAGGRSSKVLVSKQAQAKHFTKGYGGRSAVVLTQNPPPPPRHPKGWFGWVSLDMNLASNDRIVPLIVLRESGFVMCPFPTHGRCCWGWGIMDCAQGTPVCPLPIGARYKGKQTSDTPFCSGLHQTIAESTTIPGSTAASRPPSTLPSGAGLPQPHEMKGAGPTAHGGTPTACFGQSCLALLPYHA